MIAHNEWGEPTTSSQMDHLNLRHNPLEFKTSENLPIIIEESVEYTSIS